MDWSTAPLILLPQPVTPRSTTNTNIEVHALIEGPFLIEDLKLNMFCSFIGDINPISSVRECLFQTNDWFPELLISLLFINKICRGVFGAPLQKLLIRSKAH
jgi:hypothetical protein